jgi:hypothetical protein
MLLSSFSAVLFFVVSSPDLWKNLVLIDYSAHICDFIICWVVISLYSTGFISFARRHWRRFCAFECV